MNTKKWLTLGLTVALAGCLGWAVAACAPTEPNNPNDPDNPSTPHTHTFTGWDHSDTEHWRVCPDDGEIDVSTRASHVFTNGTCECGMKEADITPDEGRDTRSFWVVGSGAGDLSKCSFTELKSNFRLTKQPKKDANGFTVYTTSVLTLYAGDTMKIVQDLDWDDGLGYFGVSNIKNNDGSFIDGGTGNISPAKGKDGKYIFTVRTKADIPFSQCTLEFRLIEPVEPLKNTEEIYIVGLLQYCDTQWPDNGSVTGCKKLDYDEATGEWSITLRLGGYREGTTLYKTDEFKLYNAVNGKYYPDGTNNNKLVRGEADFTDPTSKKEYKASGDYKISWKTGDTDITLTKLEHTHVFDRMTSDAEQHWTVCWLDDTQKPDTTREDHLWENDDDTKCDKCGRTRHVHKYTQQMYDDTQHWMECPTDHAIDPEHPKTAHTIDPETHTCECGYEEHTHEYTKWEHDAKQHWKVCPKDNEIDPETPKAEHSFDPDTHTCECGYEHTHEYTKYNYNDQEHWKECPTDGVIDDETRASHTFDQEGDKCVCGMGKPDCDHSKGYAFEYDELPAAEADGGTLDKFCPDCRGKQTVTYSKGFTGDGDFSNIGTVGEISVGTYYFTTGNKSQALGMKITEAGTYTLTFEEVCDLGETDGQLGLDGLTFGTAYASSFSRAANSLVYGAAVTSKAAVKSQLQDYAVKVNEKNVATTDDLAGNLVSFSFTVTEEQLQAGDLYVTIQVGGFKDNAHVSLATSDSLSHLVTVKKD